MAKSINIRGTKKECTMGRKVYYYAVIGGRVFMSEGRKRSMYRSRGALKSALKQSRLFWDMVKPLAENYLAFLEPTNHYRRCPWELRDMFWKKFLEESVEIHSIVLPL